MSVYIITARELGIAKIGYSRNPGNRLASLNTGSPAKLELEAVMPGSRENEKDLQRKFRSQRVRFEWFKICSEIESLIKLFKVDSFEKIKILEEVDEPFHPDLSPDGTMTISDYLRLHKMTDQVFADLIGVERSTVTRMRGGQIPKKEIMLRIVSVTAGKVMANDFYKEETA